MELLTALIPVGGPLLGVIVGSILTRSTSRAEKMGDLRRAAYGAILAELSAVEKCLDWADEAIAEDAMRYFQSSGSSGYGEDNKFIGDRMARAGKRFTDDYLILSDEFISRYEAMQREINNRTDDIPPVEHEEFESIVREARPELLAIAKSEVRGRNWMWRRPR